MTEKPRSDCWEKQEMFVFSIVLRLALELTQPSIQWVLWALSPLGELDMKLTTPSSSAKVKNGEAIPPHAFIRDNFTMPDHNNNVNENTLTYIPRACMKHIHQIVLKY
jgi:hypothetical protein